MRLRTTLRDHLATCLRALPPFRGKGRLGGILQRRLSDYRSDDECIVPVTMKNGTFMRVDLRSYTEMNAFWTGRYDDSVIRRLTSCFRPGSVAFDVGANIGFYSMPFGQRLAQLNGSLYSFEPVPSNHRRLIELISINGLQEVVKPVQMALGNYDGIIHLSADRQHGAKTGNAVVLKGGAIGDHNAIARMITLDDFVRDHAIETCDMIKVDIEGGEYDFLRGGESFIRQTRPLIYLELNYCWMAKSGWCLSHLNSLARSLGYQVYRHVADRCVLATEPGIGIENALMIPDDAPMYHIARRHFKFD